MILIQWEAVKVLGREKGREIGVAIFVDNLSIGPGNVVATPRDLVREARAVRDLVRTGRVQAKSGLAREVRDLVRTDRGQAQVGMVRDKMVKVLGTKVHVSTASKLDIRQQSA